MVQKPWMASQELMLAHYRKVILSRHYTQTDNLNSLNALRAESGDRPLTMAEYIQIGEESRLGIDPDDASDQHFFRRLHDALRAGYELFKAMMHK